MHGVACWVICAGLLSITPASSPNLYPVLTCQTTPAFALTLTAASLAVLLYAWMCRLMVTQSFEALGFFRMTCISYLLSTIPVWLHENLCGDFLRALLILRTGAAFAGFCVLICYDGSSVSCADCYVRSLRRRLDGRHVVVRTRMFAELAVQPAETGV
jgi:hypothetical protein